MRLLKPILAALLLPMPAAAMTTDPIPSLENGMEITIPAGEANSSAGPFSFAICGYCTAEPKYGVFGGGFAGSYHSLAHIPSSGIMDAWQNPCPDGSGLQCVRLYFYGEFEAGKHEVSFTTQYFENIGWSDLDPLAPEPESFRRFNTHSIVVTAVPLPASASLLLASLLGLSRLRKR